MAHQVEGGETLLNTEELLPFAYNHTLKLAEIRSLLQAMHLVVTIGVVLNDFRLPQRPS